MLVKRSPLTAMLVAAVALACSPDSPNPVEPPPQQGHVFTYTPPPGAPAIQSILVRGSFNDWGETTSMTRQPDDSWRAVANLGGNRHQYKFYINGNWPHDMCYDETWGRPEHDYWIDPDAVGCEDDGFGGGNAIVGGTVGLDFTHTPTSTYLSAAAGRVSIRFRASVNQVQSATVTAGGDAYPMHRQLRSGSFEVWRASVPDGSGAYRIDLTTSSGSQGFGPYQPPGNLFRAVEWVGSSIGYQIFPERFWNGNPGNDGSTVTTDAWHYLHPSFRGLEPVLTQDWSGPILEHHCCGQYFGGDLPGVQQRLGHLEALGVSLIYLNPIFLGGSAHGYDTFDYFEVAPYFGGEPALSSLLSAARARDMRLMWDFVPNHVGVGHWAFQHAVQNGTSSPYWNWFRFKVNADQIQVGNGEHYDGWWGIGSLPELNTSNSAVHDHLMDVTRHWTEFGMDAIRVDVPESIRNPAQFFPAWRQVAKSLNPDVYLIGEVWGRSPQWVQGDRFDALMNYAIGLDVLRAYVVGSMSAGNAAREMSLLYASYPEASVAMLFNLISSHDTSRLLTLLGGGTLGGTPSAVALDRQRLASALLYGLPGVPVTFQGDECAFLGTSGIRDQHRYPVQWQSCDQTMLAHYQQLGQLRTSIPALTSPVIRSIAADGTVLSFHRGEPGTGEVLALFNAGGQSQSVTLPSGNWINAANSQAVTGTAPIPALGWLYLRRQ